MTHHEKMKRRGLIVRRARVVLSPDAVSPKSAAMKRRWDAIRANATDARTHDFDDSVESTGVDVLLDGLPESI